MCAVNTATYPPLFEQYGRQWIMLILELTLDTYSRKNEYVQRIATDVRALLKPHACFWAPDHLFAARAANDESAIRVLASTPAGRRLLDTGRANAAGLARATAGLRRKKISM